MSDGGNSNIKDTVETVKGIFEAVPVYDDALKPAAKELGKGLETIAKLINVGLFPIASVVWGYDKIKNRVITSLEKKLEKVPDEDIVEPSIHVAGPTIESLRYAIDERSLFDMYTQLLATSMNRQTVQDAHPAFVEVIKQLTQDEAIILKYLVSNATEELVNCTYPLINVRYRLDVHKVSQTESKELNVPVITNFWIIPYKANCSYPDLLFSYLDNLCRLGLLKIMYNPSVYTPSDYIELENHHLVKEQIRHFRENTIVPIIGFEFEYGEVRFTDFGIQFCKACLMEEKTIACR